MSFAFKKVKSFAHLSMVLTLALSSVHGVTYAHNFKAKPTGVLRSVASNGDAYLDKLDSYRKTLKMQVQQVFLPMVSEFDHIAPEVKKSITDTANKFSAVLDGRLNQFGQDYKDRFIDYDRSEDVKNVF